MEVLDEQQTRDALPFDGLITAVEEMFAGDCITPLRHHHEMRVPGETAATMLLMPSWVPGRYSGVKILNLFPDNHVRSLPTIVGRYLLSSGRTGEMLALIEGGELTARRTAATSALASRYLSREDASELLMVGTGRLSLNLIEAHCRVRPIRRVRIWGRDAAKSSALATEARSLNVEVEAVSDLQDAVRAADIVSCATLSNDPLIRGEWLKPGSHLDLVGAFKPTMRESDDTAILRSSVFVDTYEGAIHEGGDIAIPIKTGILTQANIRGDLRELIKGERPGRTSPNEITLFKSVGAALEDLAGAILAYETTLKANGSR